MELNKIIVNYKRIKELRNTMEKQNKAIFLFLLLLVGSFMFVSSEVNTYGSYQRGSIVSIRQVCSSCSYINISVSYPNSTLAVSNEQMFNEGGGVWTYEFNQTSIQGRYDVSGTGDLGGTPTSFDVLYFIINEYGIPSLAFGLYTTLYLLLLFVSYLFVYKFATFNGGKVKDYNFYFWAGFLDLILFVVIEINGFGGSRTLIVDTIKILAFASGLYFMAQGIFNAVSWKKSTYS